jgi:hypothetical protein
MLILLIFLSTPIRIEAGRECTTPVFHSKTRAAKDYSQGKSRTQGKIAKKAGKMQIFLERVEITAEIAGCKRFERGSGGAMGRIGAPFAVEKR